jgi:hypothetical protein
VLQEDSLARSLHDSAVLEGRGSVADDQGKEERPDEHLPTELLDKYFEFFKHLTTLNVATAIILLAISQARPAGLALVLVPLLAFGVSLLAALSGMEVVLLCLRKQDGPEVTVSFLLRWKVKAGKYLRQAVHFSLVFYVAGLMGFISAVID